MTDTRDHTPVTVVLPAYMLGPMREALTWYAVRLRKRAKLRPPPAGQDSLDRLIAGTLDEAAAAVAAARDQN